MKTFLSLTQMETFKFDPNGHFLNLTQMEIFLDLTQIDTF